MSSLTGVYAERFIEATAKVLLESHWFASFVI